MDSRITMALAGVLFVGALLAGYWGLSMSRSGAEVPQAPVTASVLQDPNDPDAAKPLTKVLAAKDIPAYATLKAEDLTEQPATAADADAVQDVASLVGKTVWTAIPSGAQVREAMLEPGGALSSMIRPHERAVAVAVDEVIAAGGHLAPGDFVDVLVYLRASSSMEGEEDTAQVVISAARLLSYGPLIGPNAGSYKKPAAEGEAPQDAEINVAQIRSAVIAIPAELSSKFMLASQAGQVRLSVRSKQEKLHEHYERGELHSSAQPAPVVAMSALTGFVKPAPAKLMPAQMMPYAQAPQPPAAKPSAPARPRGPSVEVIRGTQLQHIAP